MATGGLGPDRAGAHDRGEPHALPARTDAAQARREVATQYGATRSVRRVRRHVTTASPVRIPEPSVLIASRPLHVELDQNVPETGRLDSDETWLEGRGDVVSRY